MFTLEEVVDELSYHPATRETARQHDEARRVVIETARRLWPLLPEGPRRTLVMRHLQQALMYANLAIAMQAPVDVDHPEIARILPPDFDESDG